jgi:AraC-like DNA-binding protein
LYGFKSRKWDSSLILQTASVLAVEVNNTYLPVESAVRIFEAAQELYGEEAGLVSRLGIVPSSFQSLSLAALSAPNAFQALRIMETYQQYISNAIEYSLSDDVYFSFTLKDSAKNNGMIADAVLATTVRTLRFILPYHSVVEAVSMAREKPTQNAPHTAYFKAPVFWDEGNYKIKLNKHALLQPSMHANAALENEHLRTCQKVIDTLNTQDFSSAVMHCISQHLSDFNVTAEWIATELNISVRTLQRRLSDEGTSFSDVLQKVKFRSAKQYLLESEKSISDITQILGFTDSGNFSRAFKNWSDLSPLQFRTLHSNASKSTQH